MTVIRHFFLGLTGLLMVGRSIGAVDDTLIAFYEQHYNIPANLLRSIAYVESGQRLQSGFIAWPWTVHAQGKGFYCSTKTQAMALVHQLRQKGIHNIDVGCMQINLKYHPAAFATLDDAFEPETNIAYAAVYLKKLYYHHKSWDKAVAYYHSATPHHYQKYVQHINKMWRALSTGFANDRQNSMVQFISYETKPLNPSIFPNKLHGQFLKNTPKPFAAVRSYRRFLG